MQVLSPLLFWGSLCTSLPETEKSTVPFGTFRVGSHASRESSAVLTATPKRRNGCTRKPCPAANAISKPPVRSLL